MAGADTVLRVIMGTISIVVIIVVGAVGYALLDPLYSALGFGDLPAGWGAPQDVVMLFFGLATIGLIIVVIVWWVASSAREDVRQSQGPPF